jgi:hypothetical protein
MMKSLFFVNMELMQHQCMNKVLEASERAVTFSLLCVFDKSVSSLSIFAITKNMIVPLLFLEHDRTLILKYPIVCSNSGVNSVIIVTK